MAVKIRLREWAKKRSFYRLVVADSRAARDGAFIDNLGIYNLIAEPAELKIDEERALDWLQRVPSPIQQRRVEEDWSDGEICRIP